MRNKAPLALMEQLMMVLVFALAAALCLQVFIFSDRASRRKEAVNRAVLEAQNAAEELKSVRGDFTRAAELYGGSYDGRTWTGPMTKIGKKTTAQPITSWYFRRTVGRCFWAALR